MESAKSAKVKQSWRFTGLESSDCEVFIRMVV